ncbi:hypothetical protein FRC08_004767 [Ceratobasidium sp. 394]|nr:hypothetical protein FRC08_004767 [Ceratobasidium sp. 394]
MFRHLNDAERIDLLNKTGFLSGIRLDGNDGPRRSMHVVAKCKASGQHHSLAWMEECDDIISEVVSTQTTRETSYVHQGWSIVAATTLAPWTLSRIAWKDQPDKKGNWVTRRTIVQRLVLEIPPEDLAPDPEFEADIRAALGKSSAFERFRSLNQVFGLWGDVLPVVFELGALLSVSDTSSNFAESSATASNFRLNDLSTHKTAQVTIRGGNKSVATDNITDWLSERMSPFQWSQARIIRVIPTTDLLGDELKAEVQRFYTTLLSYHPSTLEGRRHVKSFDGTPHTSKTIQSIVVYAARYVDSLSVRYLDGTSSGPHGGKGGHEHVFHISKDEFIVGVVVWENDEATCAIQFITNMGRISPHYGGSEGRPSILDCEDGALVAFSGQSSHIVYRVQTIWRHDIIPTLPTRKHRYSTYFGGGGGAPFNDWPYLHSSDTVHISGIRVMCGSFIDSVQVLYSRTHNHKTEGFEGARHGGGGGHHQLFSLETGEYIVKVKGKYGSWIDQLCFITNRGRSSRVYGGGGGRSFECEAPMGPNGAHMRLCYIMGKSWKYLDGLLFVWAPAEVSG